MNRSFIASRLVRERIADGIASQYPRVQHLLDVEPLLPGNDKIAVWWVSGQYVRTFIDEEECGDRRWSKIANNIVKDLDLPYIEVLKELSDVVSSDGSKVKVVMVDGDWIRAEIDQEWTNFGQHYRFKFVPENEFWLSSENPKDEYPFYIEHLKKEFELMRDGHSYEDAIVQADRVEMVKRRETNDLEKVLNKKTKRVDHDKFHVKLIKTLESGVECWKVNGRLVRSVLDVDFVSGGHEYVYFFVPENEVWVDNKASSDDVPYILLHELHERNLMEKGSPYSKAHADSSKIEAYAHKHVDELNDLLVDEGW